jgi:protein SCO1/2
MTRLPLTRRAAPLALALLLAPLLALSACQRAEPLPELGTVQDFQLTDQHDKPVSLQTFAGKPWVAAFLFTRCPSICPLITEAMKRVQQEARAADLKLQLVSFSVDPSYDVPEVLRAYAQKFSLDQSNWSLLTGDSKVVGRAANESFKLALEGQIDPSGAHFGITHSAHLALVDAAGQIRGFYRSSDPEQLQRLLGDLKRLQ